MTTASRPRGPRAAATRGDVLASARRRYLDGQRVDVRAVAAEVGVSRATVYRWFGSREALLGEVIAREAEEFFARMREGVKGQGAPALLETFDRINHGLTRATALRRFVEQEREVALRTLTSSGGRVQPAAVAAIASMIEDEVRAGAYDPPVDPATLAYAIVRLAEAFIYNDALAGIRGDVEGLRQVEAVLLGVGVEGPQK
jgi:AcrR family transcriptional regulator